MDYDCTIILSELKYLCNLTLIQNPMTSELPQEKHPVIDKDEATERVEDVLSEQNKGFFSKMSEKASSILNGAYEGLYKIPIVNQFVGKLEIGYNQFWADKHEEKAVALKGEADAYDIRMGGLEDAKRGLLAVVDELKRTGGMTGSEKISLKINDLDRQMADFKTKKEKIQTKLEAKNEKVSGYMRDRDDVANKLIEFYDSKLEPMEKKLEKLDSEKNEHELAVTVTELKHRELEESLSSIEKNKEISERGLKLSGMSDKEIENFAPIKELNIQIREAREKMKKEMEALDERSRAIDKKVADVNAKANPKRDERNEFVRVTQRGRVDTSAPEKVDEIPFEGRTDVDPRTGDPLSREEYVERTRARNIVGLDNAPDSEPESGEVERGELAPLDDFINSWNDLPGDVRDNDLLPKIDPDDFYRTLKRLDGGFKLTSPEFQEVLVGYYRVKMKLTKPVTDAISATFSKLN